MSRKMLIDAAHTNEIRVAVVQNGILEELDYQNSKKKSTKGNIYLAKVTRVEPSLQAAFVEYGGARHGFLPFSEIHPDYYQIPVSDREKLLEEIRAFHGYDNKQNKKPSNDKKNSDLTNQDIPSSDDEEEEIITSINSSPTEVIDDETHDRPEFYKRYKIQEVIKKDQVILIQIEKEERGNKGAALTTYLSIAGRYCVLMPNATKGGGVSRKIADSNDRERLKALAKEMTQELLGVGAVIIRTAGASKPKIEIKRDCNYLKKLWNNIREHTVKSNAPTFIHEEGDVIKKAIRDLYDNDIDEILVQGETAFKEAKEFMQMILPKSVTKVIKHTGKTSLLSKYNIEQQIAELYSTQVSLKSGGYIVINQTEALVAIDVNSGRATSERNVESTALKTNLEAAREVAKQLKLRDLSGLVVIDFIDMEDNKNKRAVEKALREALSTDKAKIQISKVSHFGLLEMSRQRIKQSFVEGNTQMCSHCQGRGRIRQIEASALAILRAIENEIGNDSGEIIVSAANELISYLLNNKRKDISIIDSKFRGKLLFLTDESAGGDGFFIEKKRSNKDIAIKPPLSKIDDEAVDQSSNNVEVEEKTKINRPQQNHSNANHTHRPRTPNHLNKNEESLGEARQNYPNNRRHKTHIRRPNKNYSQDPTSHQEVQPISSNETKFSNDLNKPAHKHKWKKSPTNNPINNKNRNINRAPNDMNDVNETLAEKEFETEMAARRKANQSLLKEIWKKIVD